VTDLARLTITFLWLSFLCVGGGLGVIPEMQRQVIERHHWVTTREFVEGYALSQLTPGPNMLIAVFVGYRAHGIPGGLLAGLAMFLPASVLAAVVARHWQELRGRAWARTAERALGPIGIGLMAAGAWTLGRSAVHDGLTALLTLGALVILWLSRIPPVAVVLAAGVVAWVAGR
jgi:chromate transporter